MIPKQLIDRINELARKSKQEELSLTEKDEQRELRLEYSRLFKEGFEQRLLNITVVDEKGKDITPKKLKDEKKSKHH